MALHKWRGRVSEERREGEVGEKMSRSRALSRSDDGYAQNKHSAAKPRFPNANQAGTTLFNLDALPAIVPFNLSSSSK